MAWGATFDVPGSDPEFYDQTVQMVEELTHGIPDGRIVNFMSPTDDGYRVTEIRESEEQWQRFRNETLTPLPRRITGEESPEQPDPQPFPVHSVSARATE